MLNVEADISSRHLITRGDLKLDLKWFAFLNQLWGPFTIDAFASQMKTQLPRFWSRYNDDKMLARDALQQDWTSEALYCNPPYALIPRILNLVHQFHCTQCVIIAPIWPSQPWFPVLMTMSIEVMFMGNVDKLHFAPTVSHQSKA